MPLRVKRKAPEFNFQMNFSYQYNVHNIPAGPRKRGCTGLMEMANIKDWFKTDMPTAFELNRLLTFTLSCKSSAVLCPSVVKQEFGSATEETAQVGF